ncbi:MAG: hypothetical protein K6D90_05495 [Lachnospiraceae bacterium]|nr:hypothetical protein [Lachnospiraceae bacterium]
MNNEMNDELNDQKPVTEDPSAYEEVPNDLKVNLVERRPAERKSAEKKPVRKRVAKRPSAGKKQGFWHTFVMFVKRNRMICIISLLLAVTLTTALCIVSCSLGKGDSQDLSEAEPGNDAAEDGGEEEDGGGLFSLFGKKDDQADEAQEVTSETEEYEDPVILAKNDATKNGYMNNCIFLGDSRTVAMVNYGFVSDDSALAKIGIAHTAVENTTFTNNAGQQYTLKSYLQSHKAPVVYVCYGVNGMNGMAEDKYKSTYTTLVEHIMNMAPDSKVVLMSIWPVDDYGTYKNSVKNEWIEKYNKFLLELAEKKGLHYLNVAEILKGEGGQIKPEYDAGDGLHYRASAYNDILDYIIHHPVPGISDAGEFVVHYVKPSTENRKIMTETPVLPQNVEIVDPATLLTPTPTPTPTPTVTPTPTPTPTLTPTPTKKPTAKPTPSPEPTAEPTVAPEPTNNPDPTSTPDPTSAPEPTATPTPEVTEEPTPTPTPEPTPAEDPPEEDTSGEGD